MKTAELIKMVAILSPRDDGKLSTCASYERGSPSVVFIDRVSFRVPLNMRLSLDMTGKGGGDEQKACAETRAFIHH